MVNAILERLRFQADRIRTPLPGLPQLLNALSDQEIEFDELAGVLNRYPGIVARLLAAANSAWCSRGTPVTSLSSACANLGLRLVRSISISVAVSAPFNVRKCPGFDTLRFWSSCLQVAMTAELLAQRCSSSPGVEHQTVHTTGLLHNIGLLWLADQFPSELQTVFELAGASDDNSFHRAHTDVFGTGLPEVSGLLLARWGLPSTLVTAVEKHGDTAYENDEWECAALVGEATDIVASVNRGAGLPSARAPLAALGITDHELAEVYEYTRSQIGRTTEIARELGKR